MDERLRARLAGATEASLDGQRVGLPVPMSGRNAIWLLCHARSAAVCDRDAVSDCCFGCYPVRTGWSIRSDLMNASSTLSTRRPSVTVHESWHRSWMTLANSADPGGRDAVSSASSGPSSSSVNCPLPCNAVRHTVKFLRAHRAHDQQARRDQHTADSAAIRAYRGRTTASYHLPSCTTWSYRSQE